MSLKKDKSTQNYEDFKVKCAENLIIGLDEIDNICDMILDVVPSRVEYRYKNAYDAVFQYFDLWKRSFYEESNYSWRDKYSEDFRVLIHLFAEKGLTLFTENDVDTFCDKVLMQQDIKLNLRKYTSAYDAVCDVFTQDYYVTSKSQLVSKRDENSEWFKLAINKCYTVGGPEPDGIRAVYDTIILALTESELSKYTDVSEAVSRNFIDICNNKDSLVKYFIPDGKSVYLWRD